jgi:Cu/Ag efflux protein CusF
MEAHKETPMNRATFASLALAAAALSLAACADKKKSEPAPAPAVAAPVTYEDSATVAMTAKVEALDYSTRRITLRDSSGRASTFIVGQQVQRLNEVKVGDRVTADYYVAYAAELRAPTDEEKANPLVVLQQTAKAPAGTAPAGGALRVTRAVVTVEGIDRPTKSVTVKGPGGNLFVVESGKPENLSKIKVGDTIVVVYAEALAVTLEKPAAK